MQNPFGIYGLAVPDVRENRGPWCFPEKMHYGRCQHIIETWIKGKACTHAVELQLGMLCFYVNVANGNLPVALVNQRPNEFCPVALCQIMNGELQKIDAFKRTGWLCCQCNLQRIPGNTAHFVVDNTFKTVGMGHYTANNQWHYKCQNCDRIPGSLPPPRQ